MISIGTWLAALAPVLTTKVLTSLGISIVVFTGVQAALSQLIDLAATNLNSVGGDVAAILALAGLHTAMSIFAGAMTGRLAFSQLKRLGIT